MTRTRILLLSLIALASRYRLGRRRGLSCVRSLDLWRRRGARPGARLQGARDGIPRRAAPRIRAAACRAYRNKSVEQEFGDELSGVDEFNNVQTRGRTSYTLQHPRQGSSPDRSTIRAARASCCAAARNPPRHCERSEAISLHLRMRSRLRLLRGVYPRARRGETRGLAMTRKRNARAGGAGITSGGGGAGGSGVLKSQRVSVATVGAHFLVAASSAS